MRSHDFEAPDMERVNLDNRIWREQRLPIHEARTEADVWSHAAPAKPRHINLLQVRSTQRAA